MAMSPIGGRGFYDAQSAPNRIFDEVSGDRGRRTGQRGAGQAEWVPAMYAFSRDGDLVVRAELPGIKPEDINVTLSQGVLTISGERKESEEEASVHPVRKRHYGSFRRSMCLPEGTDENKIKASFGDGVLQVVIREGAAEQEPTKTQKGSEDEEDTGGGSAPKPERAHPVSRSKKAPPYDFGPRGDFWCKATEGEDFGG